MARQKETAPKKVPVAAPSRPSIGKQKKFGNIADRFKSFRPVSSVLTEVEVVPTWLVQFDHAVRVGGFPKRRWSLLHGPSHGGKELWVEEPIATPTGWKKIGELEVGDVVLAPDGQATTVTGVFPQGVKPLFDVEFSDGVVVRSGLEHLWATRSWNEKQAGMFARGPRPERKRIPTGREGEYRVRTLAQLMENFHSGDHEVPQHSPVEYQPLGNLPIDPYALGLLIGDGSYSIGDIRFSKPETDLADSLSGLIEGSELVPCSRSGEYRFVGPTLKRGLQSLGIFGQRSWEKEIPELYMRAGIGDRLALLRGLLDTDGSVKQGVSVEYATTSHKLGDQVVELARSLGAYVTETGRQTQYTYKGERLAGRPSRRITIRFNDGTVPVASKKNLAKWKARTEVVRRTIVSIRPVGVGEAVCISVAHPSRMYLTRGFIPTHNTQFLLGLFGSFLERGHLASFLDLERTTPINWVEGVLGKELAHSKCFFSKKTSTLEEARDEVALFLRTLKDGKKAGDINPETSAILGLDSIAKLVPKSQFDTMLKESAEDVGMDGMKGMSAMRRAALLKAWLDELIPLLDDSGATMVGVARETEDPNADQWARKFGNDYKIGGGKHPYFDASLVMRCQMVGMVMDERGGKKQALGERYRLTIAKSKVAGKDAKTTVCYFHTSNGMNAPQGIDRARDLIELGERVGVVEDANGRKILPGASKPGNIHDLVREVNNDKGRLAELDAEVRKAFAKTNPIEVTDDGEVIE